MKRLDLCTAVMLLLAGCGIGKPERTPTSEPDSGSVVDGSAADHEDPAISMCHFAASRAASTPALALAVALDGDVVFVMTDGSTRTAYRFEAPATLGSILPGAWMGIEQHGGFVVATVSRTAARSLTVWEQEDRAVLLDRAGGVLWEKTFFTNQLDQSHARGFAAHVGDAGHVVLTIGFEDRLVAPDGGEDLLPSMRAVAAPFPGPVLPVVVGPSGGRDVAPGAILGGDLQPSVVGGAFGWWRSDGTSEFTGHSVDSILYVAGTEARVVFASRATDGTRVVVDSRPDGTETRPWPVDLTDGVARFGSGVWQGGDLGADVVRFNSLTGESARFTWVPPAGMRRLGPAGVDLDGALVATLRNDTTAGVYRSTDGASDWRRLGRTLGDIEAVKVSNVGGTYVVDTIGTNDVFVPSQTWVAAPPGQEPDLRGCSHQLVRPENGLLAQVKPALWSVQLSRDGLCAAYWEVYSSTYQLTVYDVVSGTMRGVVSSAYPGAYAGQWVD